MVAQNVIRIAAVALCLSTLSFAAGVAGDLSIIDPPRSGQRVVLRIPPELPANTVRAAPLPPLISTASAEELRRVERVAISYADAPLALDEAAPAAQKPAPRLEVQLARAVPKAAQVATISVHERKAA